MTFIFSSCGARNAELIVAGQKLIPAVRALIFAPGGIGPKSSVTIALCGHRDRMHMPI